MWVRYDEGDTGRSREPVRIAEVLAATMTALGSTGRAPGVGPGAGAGAGVGPGSKASAAVDTLAGWPAVSTTRCRDCGAPAQWCRTVRGRWILMEPGESPTWRVPVGHRWRVTTDGTAVSMRAAGWTDNCRVSHFDTCPARATAARSPAVPVHRMAGW